MAKIILQFVTEKGWQSRLIRWFSWSRFSHVDVLIPNGAFFNNAHFIGEFLLGSRCDVGVCVRPAGYANFTAVQRLSFEVTEAEHQEFFHFLEQQIGKPYDWSAILNFGFHRTWWEPGKWFCSELVAGACKHIGKQLLRWEGKSIRAITPDLLTLSPLLTEEK